MKKKFTVEIEIEERWINDFCSMLKTMEKFGNIGHSGWVALYSDGDGDFRPKFTFNNIEYNVVDDKFSNQINYHNYATKYKPKLLQWVKGNNKFCPYTSYESSITLFDAE